MPNHKYFAIIILLSTILGIITSYFLFDYQSNRRNISNSAFKQHLEQTEVSTLSPSKPEPTVAKNSQPHGNSSPQVSYDNLILVKAKQSLYKAIQQLNTINKNVDPQEGLKIVSQVMNNLELSQKLMKSIPSNTNIYNHANQQLLVLQEYQLAAKAWENYFQTTIQNPKIPHKPQFIDLSLNNKSTFLAAMKSKAVALTFDDGPTKEYTPKILAILKKNQVKATFFVVGKQIGENCEILKKIYHDGHEIANHSYSHPIFTQISPAKQHQEIISNEHSINQCLGMDYPTQWFRAPYGRQNTQVLEIVHQLGLNSIQWIVDTNDWRKSSSISSIIHAVTNVMKPGVILMHDGFLTNPTLIHPDESPNRQNTVDAIQPIISKLKSRGFHFVILSEALK